LEEIACKVRISGRVTGVGFRYSALNQACKYQGLKGYVKNVQYGEVEVLLQGEREMVDKMLSWLSRGPFTARVDNVEISKVPCDDSLRDFTIE